MRGKDEEFWERIKEWDVIGLVETGGKGGMGKMEREGIRGSSSRRYKGRVRRVGGEGQRRVFG